MGDLDVVAILAYLDGHKKQQFQLHLYSKNSEDLGVAKTQHQTNVPTLACKIAQFTNIRDKVHTLFTIYNIEF